MIDNFVLSDMLKAVTQINPDYPADRDCDYQPLRKIAQFVLGQLRLNDPQPGQFIEAWKLLYTTAHNDPFYSDKSLATISNHIQEFYQKAKHGNKQISGSKLKQKLASRLNQKR